MQGGVVNCLKFWGAWFSAPSKSNEFFPRNANPAGRILHLLLLYVSAAYSPATLNANFSLCSRVLRGGSHKHRLSLVVLKNWKSISLYMHLFWRFLSNYTCGYKNRRGKYNEKNAIYIFNYKEQIWEHFIRIYQIKMSLISDSRNQTSLYIVNNLIFFLFS